ncbi:hypothetical protein ACQ4PT_069140 [Festuca glaucescens]
MAANTPTTNASGAGHSQMDRRLLKAATSGDSRSLKEMARQNPSILLGTTPQGNSCLHIASFHGYIGFCEDALHIVGDLYILANYEGQTPLLIAVTCGHVKLASILLSRYMHLGQGLREVILRQDRNGYNALHHAIRNGHTGLALELIAAEPALSQAVTNNNESPMFIAVMKNYTDVLEKLLEIPDSAHVGHGGRHALHAAAINGNPDIAYKIMNRRPQLGTQADMDGITPIRMAVSYNKVDVLRLLLEHDSYLGYEIDKHGYPLLCSAAALGHVDVARELLCHCPDALGSESCTEDKYTCLHLAVRNSRLEFVKFIMTIPQLGELVNLQDKHGRTALHYAVENCDPGLVAVLLSHKSVDTTLTDNDGKSAASQLSGIANEDNLLDWVEVFFLMLEAEPQNADMSLLKQGRVAAKKETDESRRHRKSLTKKYTDNTSLVAILLATITFTAGFTLPGGYSSDAGTAGLPIMSKKIAFHAFLVSDTLAMCSSFVVAFICLMGRWEDDKFTSYYIYITKKLTWFAYMTTITAFSTGTYTVLASHLHWLAIGICSLVAFLPILTMFIGKWPILRLQIRLSGTWRNFKLILQKISPTWRALMLKCGFLQGYRPNYCFDYHFGMSVSGLCAGMRDRQS